MEDETTIKAGAMELVDEILKRANVCIVNGTLGMDLFIEYEKLPSGARAVLGNVIQYYEKQKEGIGPEEVSEKMKIRANTAAGCLEVMAIFGHLNRVSIKSNEGWIYKYEPVNVKDN